MTESLTYEMMLWIVEDRIVATCLSQHYATGRTVGDRVHSKLYKITRISFALTRKIILVEILEEHGQLD